MPYSKIQSLYTKIYGSTKHTPSTNSSFKAQQLKVQLGKYASYSTALIGVSAFPVLSPNTAEAAVQVATVNVQEVGNSFFGAPTPPINIGTDADNELGSFSAVYSSSTIAALYFKFANIHAGTSMFRFLPNSMPASFPNANYAARLSSGDLISGTINDHVFSALLSGNGNGDWVNPVNTAGENNITGYLGFRFDMSGNTHYGWMEITLDDWDPGPSSITISRIAYEDIPNHPIQAGSTVTYALAPEVPTLSEWGLITLALFLMSFGTLYIGRRKEVLEASMSSQTDTNLKDEIGAVWQRPPLNWSILKKTLMGTGVLAAIAGILTYLVYGSIAAVDIAGTAITGPLFAYLTHLLWLFEGEKKENE